MKHVKKRIQKYFASGRDNDRKGQFEEARDDFSQVIALDGNHMKAFMCRGMAHMELGKFRDAQADFTEVLNLEKGLFHSSYTAWNDISAAGAT